MTACLAECLSGVVARLRRDEEEQRLAKVQHDLKKAITRCESYGALERALAHLQANEMCKMNSEDSVSPNGGPRIKRANTVIQALGRVSKLSGRIGIDIGGTLAKMVFMRRADEDCPLEERFGHSGRRHTELTFQVCIDDVGYKLYFVSGQTERFEKALAHSPELPLPVEQAAARRIVASGGGAHRFADAVRKVLNVEMVPFQEMESLVTGLEFLEAHTPPGEVYVIDEAGEQAPTVWPHPFFPCLLVNMGSGVSILRVNGHGDGEGPSFARLGGTACGGATFLGLMRLMTSTGNVDRPPETFEEALRLAEQGDAAQVNKLVSDIYGESGCAQLGLPGSMTAAYFGKLHSVKGHVWEHARGEDCAAAVLMMVVQESVVLARAFSMLVEEQCGHAPPVFFVGGFLAHNTMAERIISRTFKNLRLNPPLFLRHADFLGALGALGRCLHMK